MMNLLRARLSQCLSWARGKRMVAIVSSIVLMQSAASATDPGNVVKDGQFLNAGTTASIVTWSAGQTFGAWKVGSGSVDLKSGYFSTPDGTNCVDLNGSGPGRISQITSTVPGKTYTLKFLLSGNWDLGTSVRTMTVKAGSLNQNLSVARPAGWSRSSMQWKTMTYSFVAASTSTTLEFTSSVLVGPCGPVICDVSLSTPVDPPRALETIPVPTPPDLAKYVANRDVAIALGKALFWDMQAGGDGKTACATCHWHAGADARTRNTLHPGAPGSAFGHQTSLGPALAAKALSEFPGVNVKLSPDDFPFHRLQHMDLPESADNPVIFDSKKIVGSQGVVSKKFLGIVPGSPIDDGETTVHPVFSLDGVNVRQVTGRNSPSVINAVFFDRSFWDGRANRYFNGVNPFGNLDPNARVLKWTSSQKAVTTVTGYRWKWRWWGWWGFWSYEPVTTTSYETVTALEPVSVLIDNAALASQAVGPPNNSVEMSWDGRTFPELGRKMMSLRPLAQQNINPSDGVLGQYISDSGQGLRSDADYAWFIRNAFQPEWWSGTKLTDDGYTHMEANFSLFWGLAIMMYESTLVSDDTPFDRWRKGDESAMSETAKRGLQIFLNEGKCINCHGGPEFAGATVSQLRGVLSNDGPVENMAMAQGSAFYDGGFYNIGVRQTEEDIGVGASHPLFGPLSYSKQTQNGRNVGSTVSVPSGARIAVNGAFKTPSLRNVELTGPYFHNGGSKNLLEVVEFYTRGADFRKQNIRDLDPDVGGIPELQGNEADQLALVEFMKHLTDDRVRRQAAPFDHPQLIIPNGHTTIENGVALDEDLNIPHTGVSGGTPFMPFEEALSNGY